MEFKHPLAGAIQGGINVTYIDTPLQGRIQGVYCQKSNGRYGYMFFFVTLASPGKDGYIGLVVT